MIPLFSIIVPVYNSQDYLPCCVDSILKQSSSDFELLLINDGSSDGSANICDECAAKDSRVRVIHKTNGGASSARNAGLSVAKGDWIVFVDSDDWVDETFLQSYIPYLDKADIIFQGFITEDSEMKLVHRYDVDEKFYTSVQIADGVLYLEKTGMIGWMCNKIYKRGLIENHGIRFKMDISIQEDHLFTLEYCLFVSSLACIREAKYHYRILENSLIRRYKPYYLLASKDSLLCEYRLSIAEKFCSGELREYADLAYLHSKIGNIQFAYQGSEKLKRRERYQLLRDSSLCYKDVQFSPFTLDWIICNLSRIKCVLLIDLIISCFVLIKKLKK